MGRPGSMLLVGALLPVLACARVGRGDDAQTLPSASAGPVSSRAQTPGAANDYQPPLAEDDYAHVFYQFSRTHGFHVFIRTAAGTQREITDEPGWEARHKAALRDHNHMRRQAYIRSHPELDARIRDAISEGKLVHSMTTEQVRACAGDPVDSSRVLMPEGLVEEWHFGIVLPDTTGELPLLDGDPCTEGQIAPKGHGCVLHFLDGVLSTWETAESQRATNTGATRR